MFLVCNSCRETSPSTLLTYLQTRISSKDFSCPGACGQVCSETGKYRFFSNVTAVLSLSGLVGDHTGAFSGPEEPARDRSPVQKPPKWRNRRIIPADIERIIR